MPAAPGQDALELRTELLEVLKQLNRDEEEEDVPGLELTELQYFLSKGPLPQVTPEQTRRAVEVLIRNGLARELDDPRYVWSRARVLAQRFTITAEGKAFLVRALEKVGRI